MRDWTEFWNDYPKRANDGDLLRQVGKTVGGVPIPQTEVEALVDSIRATLNLSPDDNLLDLCCGNGLVTRQLAQHCRSVVGVDFSAPLIDVARRQCAGGNITYIQMDIRRIAELERGANGGLFTKVNCYEALAFLTPTDLDALLTDLSRLTIPDPTILLGSVLDRDRIWSFFNTFRRRVFYLVQIRCRRREVGLGRWWRFREVARIGRHHGLHAELMVQPPILHTAHYRFDARLRPSEV